MIWGVKGKEVRADLAGGKNSGRRAKNPPATNEQIAERGNITKRNAGYVQKNSPDVSSNEEAINKIIRFAQEGIKNVINTGGRVRLDDTPTVQAITWNYLDVCSQNGMLPTLTGLSMAIGCTINAIDDHMRRHPDSESSAWFRYMKTVFAEILSQSMLSGKTVSIPSIFVLKASYNWRDDPREDVNDRDTSDKPDAKAIMEKYGDLLE